MLLVDTNVLVDVLEDDPEWSNWSIHQLRTQAKIHQLFINPVIYAELSTTFSSVEALDQTVDELDLQMTAMPRAALFLAGKAFVRYRHSGGVKLNVLGDFFIGAHAAVSGMPILTRDTQRYRTYFSKVQLISPENSAGPKYFSND